MNWFTLSNEEKIDSPALIIYQDRVNENIQSLKKWVPDNSRLRPHIKTNKSPDVARLMITAGITKFKCATIAEAEMLADVGAKDVLLAHQPTGPKAQRLIELIQKFHRTLFSCIVDDFSIAKHMNDLASINETRLNVWLDLNIGMDRTGIKPSEAFLLVEKISSLPFLNLVGLHAYDGHLRDIDFSIRTTKCNEAFQSVADLAENIKNKFGESLTIVAGGTPTFPIHAKRPNVECSPGTFVFWDQGYANILKEQPFQFAVLVLSRVISKPSENILCLDLGHKAIASENPLANRVTFLNAPEFEFIGHSEEHLVVKTNRWDHYHVGDALYGVPFHVCPTVALYDFGWAVKNGKAETQWSIEARRRKISV